MQIKMLVVSLVSLGIIGSALADDLPKIGYLKKIPIKELAAKGYRWVTVNGPYACSTEAGVRRITSHQTDLTELHMIEDGSAYYLIPGTLVRVIRDDEANGMSEILLGGFERKLWTYNKFLSARPIRDIYGIVETPDTAGLIDASDTALGGSALNERSRGITP
jgi:hypothetical protein